MALRLASRLGGTGELPGLIAERAQFTNASTLVADLTARGLLTGDRLTPAGEQTVSAIGSRIAQTTEPLWESLAPDGTAATTRVLNTVLERAREMLRA